MLGIIALVGVGVGVAAAVAGFVYLAHERLGLAGWGLAALRTAALGALILLLVNPVRERPGEAAPPTVLLDASLSLAAAGGRWDAALDSARVLAGDRGVILRFGDGVAPFDTTPPTAGLTLVDQALRTAAGRSGPVYIVTDGEIADYASLPAALRDDASVVLLVRDTVPNAALLEVVIPSRVRQEDSIPITVEIGTWGPLSDSVGTLEISATGRVLLRRSIPIPTPPGAARRTVWLPPGALASGSHAVRVGLSVTGDSEERDDVRWRVVTVSELPAVVVVASPADWEGRFLMRELAEVTGGDVRGYGEIGDGRWIEMETQQPVGAATLRAAARTAALLVTRGRWSEAATRRPRWRWPSGAAGVRFARGDWYPVRRVPASPLAGPLGVVEWDSLPPLTGIVPIAPVEGEWVALSARLGRRGAERPVIVGHDSAGVREITTAAGGMWRWAFRGGASREAYRTLLAAGVDWLLASEALLRRVPLSATNATLRGHPILFRWSGERPGRDVELEMRGPDSTFVVSLRFDDEGTATLRLPPATYRWRVPGLTGASGVAVVESYSPEFHPGPVTAMSSAGSGRARSFLVGARDRWWLFVVVIAALVGEWAWRTRQGLP